MRTAVVVIMALNMRQFVVGKQNAAFADQIEPFAQGRLQRKCSAERRFVAKAAVAGGVIKALYARFQYLVDEFQTGIVAQAPFMGTPIAVRQSAG